MAIRKATQKKQVFDQLSQVAPPGESFVTCVHAETGPSPWLNVVLDRIPFLALIITLRRKFYFFTLTSSHVVLNKASRFSNRPQEVLGSWPRNQFPITNVKLGKVWSTAFIQFDAGSKPKRLNIHRFWNAELNQLLTNTTGQALGAMPPGTVPISTLPLEATPPTPVEAVAPTEIPPAAGEGGS